MNKNKPLLWCNIDWEKVQEDTLIVYYWEDGVKYSLFELSECDITKMSVQKLKKLIGDVLGDLDYDITF